MLCRTFFRWLWVPSSLAHIQPPCGSGSDTFSSSLDTSNYFTSVVVVEKKCVSLSVQTSYQHLSMFNVVISLSSVIPAFSMFSVVIWHVFPQHRTAIHTELTLWLPSSFLPIAWGMICDSVVLLIRFYQKVQLLSWLVSQMCQQLSLGTWFPPSEVQPVLWSPRNSGLPARHRSAVQVILRT